jgi:hypothetical protein
VPRAPATRRRDRTWPWLLAAVVLLAAPAALIAVTADDDHDETDHRPSPASSATSGDGATDLSTDDSDIEDVGMAHVHGLGVDPADDTLYAATHFGVFAVADGVASRVGNMQDTMGFTVVGPETFLASGHPDFSEDDEPLMGLIESRDAGRTWQQLSLRGEADFHALQVVDGTVFGYDSTSGTFMTTSDRRTWERRSRVQLHDFAVARDDVALVVGTTEEGVLRSTDGGRGWDSMPSAPGLLVVDAGADVFLGVDAGGGVHASSDGGQTWSARGSVGGAPAAMTVGGKDAAVFVADRDGQIVVSRDGGLTFQRVYAP